MGFFVDHPKFSDVIDHVRDDLFNWPIGQFSKIDFAETPELDILMSKNCARLLHRIFLGCASFLLQRFHKVYMSLHVLEKESSFQCILHVKISNAEGIYYPAFLTYPKSEGLHGCATRFLHPILPGRDFVPLGVGIDPLHPFQEVQRLSSHLDGIIWMQDGSFVIQLPKEHFQKKIII